MEQLMFEAAGEYAWRRATEPEITAADQALVRPLPPGHAVGHEGVAEVIAVGDGVST